MTSVSEITPEVKFCVRYLLEHGVNAINFGRVVLSLSPNDPKFTIERSTGSKKSFFEELAERLRELWPPGEKDGKYPWRDSVSNLARRLELLWADRFPSVDKGSFTIEQCVAVAQKYLSQFEEDTKYMMTLKYFIMKQEQLVKTNGRTTYVNKSKFADMLESNADQLKLESEWDEFVSSATTDNGFII